jgi:hypothetical protein
MDRFVGWLLFVLMIAGASVVVAQTTAVPLGKGLTALAGATSLIP